MDLTSITEVVRPTARDHLPPWRGGDGWLAGGTWLFSEPQPDLSRLIDLDGFAWPPLTSDDAGLQIAATCRIADLYGFDPPAEWPAASLFRLCCDALLASFKIWNTATVGGNLCLSLPAGSLISLTAALEAICVIWRPNHGERRVPVTEFVTDISRNVLQPGELLRAVTLPASALRKRSAFRRAARSRHGRSTVLLIGTLSPSSGAFSLTITAAIRRPVRLDLACLPQAAALRASIEAALPPHLYFDDAYGSSGFRRHMVFHLAEEIRQELADE